MTIKIWLSKNSEVSVREQIVAQISLGITNGDLKSGERLPSTRELARRFQIHQNTISAAYRRLAGQKLVEFKKGSGVYVREKTDDLSNVSALEQLINRLFQEAGALGFTFEEVKAGLRKRWSAKPLTHFLLLESDAELRKVLLEEISDAVGWRIEAISFEDLSSERANDEAEIWLIFETLKKPQKMPPHKNCLHLKANSVADSMTGKARPSNDDLIAVVSDWSYFLTLAKMFLLAAGIAPETLVLRSTSEAGWRNGLPDVSLIICDSATAKEFPGDERARVFRLIAAASLDELRQLIN